VPRTLGPGSLGRVGLRLKLGTCAGSLAASPRSGHCLGSAPVRAGLPQVPRPLGQGHLHGADAGQRHLHRADAGQYTFTAPTWPSGPGPVGRCPRPAGRSLARGVSTDGALPAIGLGTHRVDGTGRSSAGGGGIPEPREPRLGWIRRGWWSRIRPDRNSSCGRQFGGLPIESAEVSP